MDGNWRNQVRIFDVREGGKFFCAGEIRSSKESQAGSWTGCGPVNFLFWSRSFWLSFRQRSRYQLTFRTGVTSSQVPQLLSARRRFWYSTRRLGGAKKRRRRYLCSRTSDQEPTSHDFWMREVCSHGQFNVHQHPSLAAVRACWFKGRRL